MEKIRFEEKAYFTTGLEKLALSYRDTQEDEGFTADIKLENGYYVVTSIMTTNVEKEKSNA